MAFPPIDYSQFPHNMFHGKGRNYRHRAQQRPRLWIKPLGIWGKSKSEHMHYTVGGTTKLPSEITAKTCHNYAKITDMRNREKQIERQSILACIPFLKFPIVWQKHQFHPISTSKPPTQTSGMVSAMVLGWYGWP